MSIFPVLGKDYPLPSVLYRPYGWIDNQNSNAVYYMSARLSELEDDYPQGTPLWGLIATNIIPDGPHNHTAKGVIYCTEGLCFVNIRAIAQALSDLLQISLSFYYITKATSSIATVFPRSTQ